MTKLVVLGTYWNEIEWINNSLKQVELLNPDYVILCDGCFDETKYNGSQDGTAEFINEFCLENNNREKISAYRYSRFQALRYFLFNSIYKKFSFSYIYWVFRHVVLTNKYRLNQAITFNEMLKKAKNKIGDDDFFFMTYDADQFYSNEFVNDVKNILNNLDGIDLLCANEWTFHSNFSYYNDTYEKRTWNNMPHRYMEETAILPTRDIKYCSMFNIKNYFYSLKSLHIGNYFHYKFRTNKNRQSASYQLGDRKAPCTERTIDLNKFEGVHPDAIQDKIEN